MRKLFPLIAIPLFLLFSCEAPEVEVEWVYDASLNFSVKNERDEEVEIRLKMVDRIKSPDGLFSKWRVCFPEEENVQTARVGAGQTQIFELRSIQDDVGNVEDFSFVLDAGGELHLGFSEDDDCGSQGLEFDRSKIKSDSLHSVRLAGDETEPVLNGTLMPKSKVGVEAGKVYRQVSETFSVTLGDEAEISLDSVEF